ncbi:bifunctional [glutamine synthetase] adenylyltransferase/[glutamine synthetase]-adenylyl-L-tyrosine phosphorylase [Oceanibacterium hippocampi]|uniref:bifunctional [glutamine synthetase] adenylyltransferase/[glutamine synthetase]-adenylyl-L-tyrosine phosphorylase n=1 Tax=Oceanibacterium hippocampi TaxID=745714 RepID=UPI001594D488|nr:bifunctional [glutamine synthetase] adenylyltransferase/[glutamine synthetase]-adenylyl-L-tyrosine phosphorylase [Oceanibacterium hippocampi]
MQTDGIPEAHDGERATDGLTRWREGADNLEGAAREAALALAGDATGQRLLRALFGNSPFLSHAALREIAFVARLAADPVPADAGAFLAEADREIRAADSQAAVMRALRIAKRRVALAAAIYDIAGVWALDQVTGALSDLADLALDRGAAFLLAQAASRGQIELPDGDEPGRQSGLAILGMGKLGARELNYSSDIDIILLYDPERTRCLGDRHPGEIFVRIARDLVKLLQERTADGYVFRTDLRLRPDPASTPLAISTLAAMHYYESMGQNWERAAMIKARASAGDLEAGNAFLAELRPFIWRKYLDFAAIEDIQSIKRQIHAHKGFGEIRLEGHNIKLGRGGIREIEFFAQTQQLIAGGRDANLREPRTCDAIRALAETGRIDGTVETAMIEAYEFLRRLEHRLQMINDEQTQTLPADPEPFRHLAIFFGAADADAFRDALETVLKTVQGHYDQLFEASPALGSAHGRLVFTGGDDDPATIETLATIGFAEPAKVSTIVRGWHHGRHRATQSKRARELLTELMPRLLETFGQTVSPDVAFIRFDDFLSKLPAGIQLFSLFKSHPELLELVAEIMGSAPKLAAKLSRNTLLLDRVLESGFFEPLGDREALAAELDEDLALARDYQDVLDICRRFANDRKFQIGAQILDAPERAGTLGGALSDLADAVLGRLLPHVEASFAEAHGRVAGGALAVIALGRLGSREMAPGSDLDLIFVYDCDPEAEQSDGPRPLAPGPYFARLGQRIIGAISSLTGEGALYEVDMRLRPSGNAGPVAVHVERFDSYQRSDAWTWEHMALTRARVVVAPQPLRERLETIIDEVLALPRDAGRVAVDIADMRRRIAAGKGSNDPWNIKLVPGGLIDIEFVCQYLQLVHLSRHPECRKRNTADVLSALRDAGVLAKGSARLLLRALTLYRNLQFLLQTGQIGRFSEENSPLALRNKLVRAGGATDFAGLTDALLRAEGEVREIFEDIITVPAEAAAAAETASASAGDGT